MSKFCKNQAFCKNSIKQKTLLCELLVLNFIPSVKILGIWDTNPAFWWNLGRKLTIICIKSANSMYSFVRSCQEFQEKANNYEGGKTKTVTNSGLIIVLIMPQLLTLLTKLSRLEICVLLYVSSNNLDSASVPK